MRQDPHTIEQLIEDIPCSIPLLVEGTKRNLGRALIMDAVRVMHKKSWHYIFGMDAITGVPAK
jgi:hypothetical protein